MATVVQGSLQVNGEGPIAAKNILAQLDGKFPVDEAVIEALPPGLKFVSAEAYGSSAWTVTGKITAAQEADGTESYFFLKTAFGEHGGVMLRGEYESAKDIYKIMPCLIPRPFGYGRYQTDNPVTYFYLSNFVDMNTTTAPKPLELAINLARLHKESLSPNGMFGYHVGSQGAKKANRKQVTCDGKMPHNVEWEPSWAVFFGKLLRRICDIDLRNNGSWPELERATQQVIAKVVPRLLGDLRSEGGSPIKPCLLHGDLWEPNLGVDIRTGKLVMYDVGSYYAHNEMELGQWRTDFCSHLRSRTYTQEYLKQYPPAEPAAEFDDRNRLYSLKSSMNYSAGHPGCVVRQTAYNNMCYLCEKYAPCDGIDAYDPGKDPSVTGARFAPSFTKPDGDVGN
ncbi:hypothetical protein VMCG_09255 [Cytospora schulzeri]|uniref:protein-ribulosamine 3-kinase n=1 Tax=Cytospora schulzeri TaxID=448051 RepID=A0A423VL01_9PEZI|nr:hypothetical protein VMCG_09255 [Valsa malicola]